MAGAMAVKTTCSSRLGLVGMRPSSLTARSVRGSIMLPSTYLLQAAVAAPDMKPRGIMSTSFTSTEAQMVGPDVFKDAQIRTPKGWKKVIAVNTATLGVELHGQDDTVAAVKAVRQAFETISLPSVLDLVPGGIDQARAKVKVAVPYPDGVDKSKVEAIVPLKNVEIKVVRGGLSWNSGIILHQLGDPSPDEVDDSYSSDDEQPVTAPDAYKVAVAAVRVGW